MASNLRRAFGFTCGLWLLLSSAGVLYAQTPGWTAGTGKITTSDNIGIGVANPDAQLHIFGSATLFKAIPASDNGSGQTWGTYIRDTLGSDGYSFGTALDLTGNSLIRVSNLRIGYVGWPEIESLSSTTPLYLNLWNGSDVVVSQAGYANGLRVQGVGSSSFAGKLGVGLSTPNALLHLKGQNVSSRGQLTLEATDYTQVTMYNGGTEVGNWYHDIANNVMYFGTASSAGQLQLVSGGNANAVRIDSNGNMGIGNTAPGAKLQVNSVANTEGVRLLSGNTAGWTGYTLGRTSTEMILGIAAGSGQFVGNAIAGDVVMRSQAGRLMFTSSPTGLTNDLTLSGGNVMIGTTVPAALLTVGTAGGTGTKVVVNGDITVSGNINAKYQDVAEWVPAAEAMEPGTVVVLSPRQTNEVMPSTAAYDTTVAGVVSAEPGVILGEAAPSKALIATTGRVRVRVDASHSPIRIGDLLVTSGRSGVAMRSQPIEVAGARIHRPGTLIGKALEPLDRGEGEILVLLSLQ